MKEMSQGPIRTPVRREKAESLMLITLLAFGGSVMLTRGFLELAGYPQLGGGGLHIAHVVWGGLFLFVATLLPLILANSWALTWSAVAGGIGFGLFIDEVGKFITQSNDYFYPPAAPIVYTLFIITVLVFIHIRRPRDASPREELYRVLHGMTELLDHDLDATEKAALLKRLESIRKLSGDPSMLNLAESLDAFIRSEHVITAADTRPKWLRNFLAAWKKVEDFFTQERMRITLILGLGIVGGYSVYKLIRLGILVVSVFKGVDITSYINPADVEIANQPLWFIIRLAVQGLVGLLSFLAAVYLLLRRDNTAVTLAILGLTVSLAVVNILIYYLDQFSASFGAIFDFILLIGVVAYRERFLVTPRTPNPPPVKI